MSRELDERAVRMLDLVEGEGVKALSSMLDEVERRGLDDQYVAALCNIVQVPHGPVQMHADYVWRLLNATPEQHCRAFLAVLEQTNG